MVLVPFVGESAGNVTVVVWTVVVETVTTVSRDELTVVVVTVVVVVVVIVVVVHVAGAVVSAAAARGVDVPQPTPRNLRTVSGGERQADGGRAVGSRSDGDRII